MKRVSVFISLLVLSAIFDASFIQNSWNEARAIQAYKHGKYDEALKIYNQLATDKPYDAECNYNIGDILYKSGKFQESIPYFKRAIEHGNMHIKVQATFNIGNVHMQEKAYDDAIKLYEEVLKMHPENQPAKHNLEVAKKLKEQEDQKQNQEQNQDSQDQENDQDEKQGQDSQQKDQKQDSKSNKNNKKESGDQKNSGSEKDQKNEGSSEKQEEKGADQKQGQNNQEQDSNDQKQDASKNNAEKSDEEIEKDLTKAQKQQCEQQEKQEKKQSAPQSGKAAEEKENFEHLDDSLYQEMQKSAADDDRLSEKESQLMQQMEDLEKNITRNVMKHMIRTQTAGADDGKKW